MPNRDREQQRGGISTEVPSHYDAAGMYLDEDVLTALEKAATEAEKAKSKGAASKNKADRKPKAIPGGRSDDASGGAENSG